ncbi:HNH endonuclease [Aquamicrobium segne]|uniref:HNH endonuclease n=1 Tax=Aquamicrobium segne TaxID=469547 RepID=A0ABW0GW99_9HYPH
MARPVKEWIGDTDEQRAPPRVRLRVFDNEGGKCHICRQPIIGKKWALDHVIALINGGENRERNLKPVHVACHAEKTAADVAEKAKVAARRKAHLRIVDAPTMQGQPFQKSRKAARRQQAAANKLPIPQRTRPMFAPKEDST